MSKYGAWFLISNGKVVISQVKVIEQYWDTTVLAFEAMVVEF